ncbi:hypothetical protein CDAR_540911 [Caerostris darwini]|uniref:Uncharacterized protein n=1 Tax=Caerostris darwini TaxID=1538125 RepID=A0AAV4VKX0_9ARAC|nr:hypothetical protein CDAR_540911 [Caerostris darwini]
MSISSGGRKSTPPCEEIAWVAKERNGPCLCMCGDSLARDVFLLTFPQFLFWSPWKKPSPLPWTSKKIWKSEGTVRQQGPVCSCWYQNYKRASNSGGLIFGELKSQALQARAFVVVANIPPSAG